jgi:hypothetical protein
MGQPYHGTSVAERLVVRHRREAARGGPAAERGIILLWAVMVLAVLAGIFVVGVENETSVDRGARMDLAVRGQAPAVAEAGIVDAFAWFRRQAVQPVVVFAPRRDLGAAPPVNETDDAAVGLVREFEIAPDLWARYEVRRSVPAEDFVDEDGDGLHDEGEPFTDTDGNGRRDDARGTRDVTAERGLPGTGAVWRIESHGFLFHRRDAEVPLGTPPNDRLASASVATEIRRLTITPPSAAALCAARGDAVRVGARGRVTGGAMAGIAHAPGTGSPTLLAGSEVTGSPPATAQPDFDAGIEPLFGVSVDALRSMADVSTDDPAVIPSPIGDHTLVVVDGDVVFTEARPLRGTGAVVVLGDCTLASGSNSFFSGLLYVVGDLTVRAPAYVRGVVIATGAVDVAGTGGDTAELQHDEAILAELLRYLGQYRHSKAVFTPSRGDGATP